MLVSVKETYTANIHQQQAKKTIQHITLHGYNKQTNKQTNKHSPLQHPRVLGLLSLLKLNGFGFGSVAGTKQDSERLSEPQRPCCTLWITDKAPTLNQ